MAFYHGPRIVTNGLIMLFDAVNPKSYPGSGTAWNDLLGNYTGTITGGTTSLTNGHMDLGPSGLVQINWGNGINPFSEEYTMIGLIKAPLITGAGMWLDYGTNGTNQRFYSSLNDLGTQAEGFADIPARDTDWHMNTIVTNGSGNISLFQDDYQLEESRTVTSYTIGSNFELGGRASYYWDGLFDYWAVYDRALTKDEILQNYNALKGRYQV